MAWRACWPARLWWQECATRLFPTPGQDIVVMAMRAEEAGASFPFGCPGSRAATGILPLEALAVPRMDAPMTLGEAMRAEGFDQRGRPSCLVVSEGGHSIRHVVRP
jgi:hypothetical protein